MTTLTLASRLRGIEGSPTLALAAKAKALAKAGKAVLDFTAGEPDFPTPASIKRAGIQSIESNQTRYTPVAGIPELREAIAKQVNTSRGTTYSSHQTIVSCGTKHALYNIFQALTQPGDEVIVLSPYWVSFPSLVRLSGATPIIVETQEAEGFQPNPEAIREAITPSTKAIIINSPSNPTGAVIDEPRLKALAELALRHDLLVVSDEIYDQLVFPPQQHRSIVQVNPAVIPHTMVVGGVSKTYSMTGWRIGYAIGPSHLIEGMINLQSHSTSNPTSISQYAALAALSGDQAPVAQMRDEFQRRRDHLVAGLNHLNLHVTTPAGAFYAWSNVSRLGNADAVAARWLDEALIAVVPGEGFGASTHVRFSFAASLETIEEGLRRLGTWLTK